MSVYNFPQFLRKLMESGLEYFGVYYGIYRAEVKDNQDPKGLGRLKIQCTLIHGNAACEVWAWPQSPWASDGCGLWVIPDIGDQVYVTFDHGRADQPIWSGSWWANNEPSPDMTTKKVTIATKEGMKLVFDRDAKTITMSQRDGNSVVMSSSEVRVTHGIKIVVESPEIDLNGKVVINGDVAMTGDGNVIGNWFASNNSAHHTHPVSNGTALRNDP